MAAPGGLPDARNRTLVDGVSDVDAFTLNFLQDDDMRHWRATRGGDLLVFDDFLGNIVDQSKWGGPNASPNYSVGGDVPADSSQLAHLADGVLKFVGTTSPWNNGGWTASPIQLFGRDWRYIARVRFPNINAALGGAHSIKIGLFGGADEGDANFTVQPDGVAGASRLHLSTQNSTRDVVIDIAKISDMARYYLLEFRCIAGVLYSFIDGQQVDETAWVGGAVNPIMSASGNNPACGSMYIDKIAIWSPRYPLFTQSAAAAGPYYLEGVAFFDGSQDFIDVTFSQPFVDNTWNHNFDVLVTDSMGDVIVNMQRKGGPPGAKTSDGLRIKPSERFTGEVCWQAWRRA